MESKTYPAGDCLTKGKIFSSREVAPRIYTLDFELDKSGIVTRPEPGQFYNIDCGGGREHLLRRPLSVHSIIEWKNGKASLRFLVEVVGWGTEKLCLMDVGMEVSMLGPLGRGFHLEGECPLIIAGGMGVAPLYFLANEMDKAGSSYCLLAGFSAASKYYPGLEDLAGDVTVFSEDGSVGRKGTVSGGLKGFLEEGNYSSVFTCGPEAMMVAVAGLCESSRVPCQVSLAARMACGIGACRGCVRRGNNGRNLCVCSEGPVFDSRDVLWTSE